MSPFLTVGLVPDDTFSLMASLIAELVELHTEAAVEQIPDADVPAIERVATAGEN